MTREQDLNRYLIGTTVFRCHPQGPRGHGVSLRGAMMTRILIAGSGDRSVDEVFEHLSSLPNAKAAIYFRRFVSPSVGGNDSLALPLGYLPAAAV